MQIEFSCSHKMCETAVTLEGEFYVSDKNIRQVDTAALVAENIGEYVWLLHKPFIEVSLTHNHPLFDVIKITFPKG